MRGFDNERSFRGKRRDETVEDMMHLAAEAARLVQVANDLLGRCAVAGVLKLLDLALNFLGQLLGDVLAPPAQIVGV